MSGPDENDDTRVEEDEDSTNVVAATDATDKHDSEHQHDDEDAHENKHDSEDENENDDDDENENENENDSDNTGIASTVPRSESLAATAKRVVTNFIGRRGMMTSAVAGLAAAAVAIAAGARGCQHEVPAPVRATSEFTRAVAARDRAKTFELLSHANQETLRHRARLARDLVGTNGDTRPQDLIRINNGRATAQPTAFDLLSRDGNQAQVKVTFSNKSDRVLSLRREHGVWRVHLPLEQSHGN